MDSTVDDAGAFLTDLLRGRVARETVEEVLGFDIVAVTPEQVRAYELLAEPGGKAVRRGDYDGPAVKLEAMDAPDFADILRTGIDWYLDMDQLERQRELLNQAREEIRGRVQG